VAVAVQSGWIQPLDVEAMRAVGRARRDWLTGIMRIASVVGSGAVEIPLALLLSYRLARARRRREASRYAAAVLSGWALYALAKYAFGRARPKVIPRLMHGEGWYSFPSGHSMLAPLVYGLFAHIWSAGWSRRARLGLLLAAAALALLLASSRVYLGMHWPTDAVGGLLLGTGWAAAAVWWSERGAWRAAAPPLTPPLPAPPPDPG
jgi:undecaprenyl-diphosphatase